MPGGKGPLMSLVVRGPSHFAQSGANGLFVQGGTPRVVQSSLHLDTDEYNFTGPDLRRRVVDSVLDETRGVPRRLDMHTAIRDMWVIRPQLPNV